MNKVETTKLFSNREAWAKWVEDCLAKKEAGDSSWRTLARADFSRGNLNDTDFSGLVFPGDTSFSDCTFGTKANFSEAHFYGNTTFRNATFKLSCSFQTSQFEGTASFVGVRFLDGADFRGVTFFEEANMMGATFTKRGFFDKARFDGTAHFEESVFSELAWFRDVIFSGIVEFQRAQFHGFANFQGCKFGASANFNAISSESAFNLANAQFAKVPNFIQAHFLEAPRLDNVQVPTIGECDSLCGRAAPEAAPRYRALKRLAIDGHDHDRELRFFADELRSLRRHPDQPLPNLGHLFRKGKPLWQGGARYWSGIFYEIFSNFGRSIPDQLSFGCSSSCCLQSSIL